MRKFLSNLILAALCLLILGGCSAQSGDQAPQAVEKYLEALVQRDLNAMISVSCAAWEANAKTEYDSFAAVKLNMQDLSCQQRGQDGEYALVACNGSIIANYGAEDLVIDVADRTYQVVQEGGEWRMCGYSAR